MKRNWSTKKLSTLEFIKKAQQVHCNKFNYSKVNYINSQTKVIMICPIHGEFEQRPASHLFGIGCNECGETKKLTTDKFIEKAIVVHNNKYIYDSVNYITNKTKVNIICPEHGVFEQTPSDHLHGIGCYNCGNNSKKLSKEEFIRKAREIHGDKYDYSKVEYHNSRSNVIIICNKHGEFEQNSHTHLRGCGCQKCNSSKGELAIKAILNKYGIEAKQEWKIPDEKYLFEYDFYLPELNVLIEFHGKQHYEHIQFFHKTHNDFEEQRLRDKSKVWLAKLKGIPLIEVSYKQFKHLSNKQFEDLIISSINRKTRS